MKRALLATTLVMGLAAFSGAAARADEAASTVGAPPPPPSECGGMHHGPGGPGGHILRLDGIKLTADQFRQTMMLAQGEFLQILMASTTTT